MNIAEEWVKAPETTDRFLVLEPDFQSYFGFLHDVKPIPLASGKLAIPLAFAVRAKAVALGEVESFDAATRQGRIKIDGVSFALKDNRDPGLRHRYPLEERLGEPIAFHFYPTIADFSAEAPRDNQTFPFEKIRITGGVFRDSWRPPNLVDAIGRLVHVWKGGFELWVWSGRLGHHVRVPFAGEGPRPEDIGGYVWACGRFEGPSNLIRLSAWRLLPLMTATELGLPPRLEDELRPKRAEKRHPDRAPEAPKTAAAAPVAIPTAPAEKTAARPNAVPGRLELTIKINELPKVVRATPTGWKEFEVLLDDGRAVALSFRPKNFKKLEDAAAKFPSWVAAISGKLGPMTERGFALSDPNVMVFERKPKGLKESSASS